MSNTQTIVLFHDRGYFFTVYLNILKSSCFGSFSAIHNPTSILINVLFVISNSKSSGC